MFLVHDFSDEAARQNLPHFSGINHRAMRTCLSLGLTTRDMREALDFFLADYGLSRSRFLTLLILYRTPDKVVSPSELAQRVGVRRATMTRTLDKLARDGLVARTDNVEDRRKKRISLTKQGLALLQKVVPEHSRCAARFATFLVPTEWATLAALLARLQDGIERFKQSPHNTQMTGGRYGRTCKQEQPRPRYRDKNQERHGAWGKHP